MFTYVRHKIWEMLWKWCLRRHSEKSKNWVRKKYFGSASNGQFQAHTKGGVISLYDVSSTKIERHVKVKGAASPDDPDLRDYWSKPRLLGSEI